MIIVNLRGGGLLFETWGKCMIKSNQIRFINMQQQISKTRSSADADGSVGLRSK